MRPIVKGMSSGPEHPQELSDSECRPERLAASRAFRVKGSLPVRGDAAGDPVSDTAKEPERALPGCETP
jgi:hypothetical protein